MSSNGIASVEEYALTIRTLLARAEDVKPAGGIDPPLNATDFEGHIEDIGKISKTDLITGNPTHYAAIETAFKNIFYELLVRALYNSRITTLIFLKNSRTIEDRSFGAVWNLLDIVTILSDLGDLHNQPPRDRC